MKEQLSEILQNFLQVNTSGSCITAWEQGNQQQIWFQLTSDNMLNLALPIKKSWFQSLETVLPPLLDGMTILDYRSKRYITLDVTEQSLEQICDYLVVYFEYFFGDNLIFLWKFEEI